MSSPQDTAADTAGSEAWAVGTAVLAVGPDLDGVESLAVWHVGVTGGPTGAWIEPWDDVVTDVVAARRALVLIERRALVAAGASVDVDAVVSSLTASAEIGAHPQWWSEHLVSPFAAYGAIVGSRDEIRRTVDAARCTGRSASPVSWSRDLPMTPPESVDALLTAAHVAVPQDYTVASAAIAMSRLLRWTVAEWTETEQVKARRGYVEQALGPGEALPPAWSAAVRRANVNRLAL